MDKVLVTVFLLTYNHSNSFRQAIESVLEQKTNFSYKIVILDDCSTDGTTDIVKEYVNNYANVNAIIQEKNIGTTLNLYNGLKNIDTKYFAILETDDYWCNENKLQIQVDTLEKNPDCSCCAHNALINYLNTGKSRPYLNCKSQKFSFPPKKIPGDTYIEPHTATRLYRSSCLDFSDFEDPIIISSDICSAFYFLLKGNVIYIDEIMSVYNYSGQGIYSNLKSYAQRFRSSEIIYKMNKEFDFKYNNLLSKFFARVINLNFFTYIKVKYLTPKSQLDMTYKKILDKYKNKYLTDFEEKPIFKLTFPIGKKKRIAFEIKREKERA